MAEATQGSQSSTQQSQQTSQPPATPAKGKLTILASTEDAVAQPDSFRGSEEHLKDLDVEDLEEERRETHRKLSERKEK